VEGWLGHPFVDDVPSWRPFSLGMFEAAMLTLNENN
jgi:hypothetical protein